MEALEKIYAPISGIISDLKVIDGSTIKSGQMILTIKSENFEKIVSNYKTGTISQILVKEGEKVKQGDLIATVYTEEIMSLEEKPTNPNYSNNSSITSDEKPKVVRNSTTAGLLAFFIGSLGVHDFYAGRITNGILKLVLFIITFFSSSIEFNILMVFILNTWIIIDMYRIAKNKFNSDEYEISTLGNSTTWLYIIIALKIIFSSLFFFFSFLVFFT